MSALATGAIVTGDNQLGSELAILGGRCPQHQRTRIDLQPHHTTALAGGARTPADQQRPPGGATRHRADTATPGAHSLPNENTGQRSPTDHVIIQ